MKKECPVCNSSRKRILFKSTLKTGDLNPDIIQNDLRNTLTGIKKHARIVECKDCKTIFTNPRENLDKFMEGYEAVEDPDYLKTKKYRMHLIKKHVKKLKTHRKKGTLLDVGCFCGFFIEAASKNGFKVAGLDPSRWATSYVKKKGFPIYGKTLSDIKNKKFDIVTMWDVIEHVPDPMSEILLAKKILNKDGLLILGTPNISNFLVRILGDRHPFFVRMHITLFTPENLSLLLEKAGFKIVEIYLYRRDYPLSYFLDRLSENSPLFKNQFKKMSSLKLLTKIRMSFLPKDEFAVIAKTN